MAPMSIPSNRRLIPRHAPPTRRLSPLGIEERGYAGDPVLRPRKLVKTLTPIFDFLLKSFVQMPQQEN